jgi:hypothetical protein
LNEKAGAGVDRRAGGSLMVTDERFSEGWDPQPANAIAMTTAKRLTTPPHKASLRRGGETKNVLLRREIPLSRNGYRRLKLSR